MEQFIGTLFHARTQAHIAHLQTTSYAKHKALDEFYTNLVDLVDEIAEMYQGRHGIIKGYKVPVSKDMEDENVVVAYFETLGKFIDNKRGKLPQDTELQNTIDEVRALIDSTLYKLKFLK